MADANNAQPLSPNALPVLSGGHGLALVGQVSFDTRFTSADLTVVAETRLNGALDRAITAALKAAKAAGALTTSKLRAAEEAFKTAHAAPPADAVADAEAVVAALKKFHPDAVLAPAAEGWPGWGSRQAHHSLRVKWAGDDLQLDVTRAMDETAAALYRESVAAGEEHAKFSQEAQEHRNNKSRVPEKAKAVTASFILAKLRDAGEHGVIEAGDEVIRTVAEDMGVGEHLRNVPRAIGSAGAAEQ